MDLSDDPELLKLEEKGTRGHYTSVESIKELEDGRVEWRMATSSTPGGRIPNFIVESTMAGQIAAVSLTVSLHKDSDAMLDDTDSMSRRMSLTSCTGTTASGPRTPLRRAMRQLRQKLVFPQPMKR